MHTTCASGSCLLTVPRTHNQDLAYFVQHALPQFIRQFQAAANASVPVMVAFEEGVAEGRTPAELQKPADISDFVSMLREYFSDATYMLHGCCTCFASNSIDQEGGNERSASCLTAQSHILANLFQKLAVPS